MARWGGVELLHQNAEYLGELRAGKEPSVPCALTAFYRDTHEGNLNLANKKPPAS
jgi:hypothetical protein